MTDEWGWQAELPPDKTPRAEVIKVGPLRRYTSWRTDPIWGTLHSYWDVTIRCPHCGQTHMHGWIEGEPEPGWRVPHCAGLACGPSYYIPAPGPHVPVPGVCGRLTKELPHPCGRPVRHTGDACHLDKDTQLTGDNR